MKQKLLRTTFAHPTPELPVEDVERAQQHYRKESYTFCESNVQAE